MPLASGPGALPRTALVVLGRREPLLQVLLADVPVEFVAAAEQQAAGHALQCHGEPRYVVAPGLRVFRGDRPSGDQYPLARGPRCRGKGAGGGCRGRLARRPWPGWAGLGPDGAAVWYRPVVRMRHR